MADSSGSTEVFAARKIVTMEPALPEAASVGLV